MHGVKARRGGKWHGENRKRYGKKKGEKRRVEKREL